MAGWDERVTASRWGFWLILGLISSWRFFLWLTFNDPVPNPDGILYIEAAKELTRGHLQQALSIYPMPALPGLIALLHWTGLDWVQSGRAVSSLFLALSSIPLYCITRGWFGPGAGLWAVLALNLPYFTNRLGLAVYRDPCHLFFFLLAILQILRAVEAPSATRVISAFCASLLPGLFRVEGLFLIPFFPLILLLLSLRDPRFRGRPAIAAAAWLVVLGVVAGIVVEEGVHFNRLDMAGKALTSGIQLKFLQQYREIYQRIKSLESLSPVGYLSGNFSETARHYLWLIYLIGVADLFVRVFHPAFLLPLAIGIRKEYGAEGEKRPQAMLLRLEWRLVWAVWLIYIFIIYLHLVSHNFSCRRFYLVPSALLYPWVGMGMVYLLRRLGGRHLWRAFILLLFFMPLCQYGRIWRTTGNLYAQAAEWLKGSACSQLSMMGNDLRVPFVAGVSLDLSGDSPGARFRLVHLAPWEIPAAALRHNRDLVVLKLSRGQAKRMTGIPGFVTVRRFEEGRKVILFLAREGADQGCLPSGGRSAGEGLVK